MPRDVIMPALGMAQDTGLIVAWRKEPGDAVSESDILFEVETDKSVMEVEAGYDGFVAEIRVAAGEEAPVGGVIAVLADEKPAEGVSARPSTAAPAVDGAAAPSAGHVEGHGVIMPALGMAQDTGLIVAWRKEPGDAVSKGDALFEVETDKSVMEVEADASGYVARILVAAGGEAPVGEVIAVITDEKPAHPLGPGAAAAKPAAKAETSRPAPAAKAPAATPELAPPAAARSGGRVFASPKARRLAAERGIDVAGLAARGVGQPILAADLDGAAASPPPPLPGELVVARAPRAGFDAFVDWLGREGAVEASAVLAAFAAAGLRDLQPEPDAPITVATETARYADPDRGRLLRLLPAESVGAPSLVVRDLRATRLTASRRPGDGGAPVLTLQRSPTGEAYDVALDAAHLQPEAAALFVDAVAARVEDPLRHLL